MDLTPLLHQAFSPGSILLWVLLAVITVFAFVRALMRGKMLWLMLIIVTGPIGAIAYWLVSSMTDLSGSGRSVNHWPKR